MSINANELILYADQTPGVASFSNFEEVKEYLQEELSVYNSTEYSIDNIKQAERDLKVLKAVKKKLTDKRKELKDAYSMPIETVLEQLDELIEMVKVPYNIIDRMLKDNAKNIKEIEIYKYAYAKAERLGEYKEKVLTSPAFFNPKWKNITCKERDWKQDVDTILERAKNEIPLIKSISGENADAALAFYFDRLSLTGVNTFIERLTGSPLEVPVSPLTGEVIENTVDSEQLEDNAKLTFKVLSVVGSEENIERYINSAYMYNVKIEVLAEKVEEVDEDGVHYVIEEQAPPPSCIRCGVYRRNDCFGNGNPANCEFYEPIPYVSEEEAQMWSEIETLIDGFKKHGKKK